MTAENFRAFANSYKIRPQIDLDGDLQSGIRKVFEQVSANDPTIRFVETDDKRILCEHLTYSYLGETLMQVITQLENEYPITFGLLDTEDGELEIHLDYNPRRLTFREVIEYRRTHPE